MSGVAGGKAPAGGSAAGVRAVAFYLPQFHPIPENDRWWGAGYTEWRAVVQARPRFRGHYQPHLPADLGFYDLRLPETREAQAALAREYGIHGFCYYHYWFGGRRLLERPFEEVLASGRPDFPFCLCWANENWTRAWDGGDDEILMKQAYSAEDDAAHVSSLLPAFSDPRYIRVEGRPLFLVYRAEALPNPRRTADAWRRISREAGVGEVFLAAVESFSDDLDPAVLGFDATVEFAPDWRNMHPAGPPRRMPPWGAEVRFFRENAVETYDRMAERMCGRDDPPFLRFRCVSPGFDNSPRRSRGAVVFHGSTPERYQAWLRSMVRWTVARWPAERRLVFVNAWNEWGEGNHLEPDLRWGRAYLEATARALAETGS